MDKKKDSGGRLEQFFAGKGFYIVLFLCIAVIAVSTWILIGTSGKTTDVADDSETIANMVETVSPGEIETVTPEAQAESAVAPAVTPDTIPAEEEPTPDTEPLSEPSETVQEPEEEAADTAAVWSEESPVIQSEPLFVWPVPGEVENGYSAAALVYNRTMADWRTHEGLDISAEIGTQVLATAGGIVESVYDDDLYGTTVVIAHANGLKSVYSNLASQPTVYEGDNVSVGEIIGSVGDTAICETSEITHLHFAMTCNDASVDPLEYLPEH